MSSLQKIAIIGGGGSVGSIILRGLLSAPHLSITALKRPSSTFAFPSAPNLSVVETDYAPDALVQILKDHDAVISIVGGTAFGEQNTFIDAAVKAGVKRFYPSEFSVNDQSATVKQLVPFFAVKQGVIDYLIEKEKDGLTWTALIVGPLLDWSLANGFAGFDLTSKRAVIWDDGETRFSSVSEDVLGKAIVASLEHPTETANKFIYISSLATTQNEILQALEKATFTKWTVKHTTTTEQLGAAQEALGKGDFSGAFTLVKAAFWSNLPGLHNHYEVDEKDGLFNEILNVKKDSLQEMVERVLAGEVQAGYYAE
ncbi:NmrA-like family protein [Microthyrium microscopicum]|uniref:NmrA-like family protein n=1 Tax=Microthyrium microscopicum TaxID=703497 RepID=A0A6A6U1V3_9PEZI|nr:NmrA-like family protein [Microthyrium microscopicum]